MLDEKIQFDEDYSRSDDLAKLGEVFKSLPGFTPQEGEDLFNYILLGTINDKELERILDALCDDENFRASAFRDFSGEMNNLYKTYSSKVAANNFVYDERFYRSFKQNMRMNGLMTKLASLPKRITTESYDQPKRSVMPQVDPIERLNSARGIAEEFMKIFRANPIAYIADLAMRHSAGAIQVEQKHGTFLSVQDHTIRTLFTSLRTPLTYLQYLDPKDPIFEDYNKLLNENFVPALLSVTLMNNKGFTLDPTNTNPDLINLAASILHERAWNKEIFKYPFFDKLDLSPRSDVERMPYNPNSLVEE